MSAAFIPAQDSAFTITPSGSATGSTNNLLASAPDMRLAWKATTAGGVCQVRWGKGAQTATTSHMTMLDGVTEVFTKQDADTLSVIGTGTLYVVCGTGI